MFAFTPAGDLCCVWFIYPALCWFWCPEVETVGTNSIDWAQLSRHLPEERVRNQSPKRWFKKLWRWTMSKYWVTEYRNVSRKQIGKTEIVISPKENKPNENVHWSEYGGDIETVTVLTNQLLCGRRRRRTRRSEKREREGEKEARNRLKKFRNDLNCCEGTWPSLRLIGRSNQTTNFLFLKKSIFIFNKIYFNTNITLTNNKCM